MNTAKTIYWVALAAFALALNSEYRQGQFPALHRVADRAESTLCSVATHAEQTIAMARLLTGRQALPVGDLRAATVEMADAQAELREQARDRAELMRDQVRAQAEIMRAQAQIERAQIEQIRLRKISQFEMSQATNRRLIVVHRGDCARSGSHIAVNASTEPYDDPDEE